MVKSIAQTKKPREGLSFYLRLNVIFAWLKVPDPAIA
jgi:hypothetical protein